LATSTKYPVAGGAALIEGVFNGMPQLFTQVRQLREENSLLRAQSDNYCHRLDTQDQYMAVQVGSVLKGIERLERLWEKERNGHEEHVRKILQQMERMTNLRETESPQGQGLVAAQKVQPTMRGNETDGGVNGSGDYSMTSEVPKTDFGQHKSVQECLEGEGAGGKVADFSTSKSVVAAHTSDPTQSSSHIADPAALLPQGSLLLLPASEPISPCFHELKVFPPAIFPPNSPISPDPTLLVSDLSDPSCASRNMKRKAEGPPLEEGSQSKRHQPGSATQRKGGQKGRKKASVRK
jgi:hypothetical protein